mmetsp:Transcript_12631/g.36170  ORF Transcript_12631/g.36170 Transcript_12631/m.36170 type:complete len:277 (-) Transcript_12631:3734-4564(-)
MQLASHAVHRKLGPHRRKLQHPRRALGAHCLHRLDVIQIRPGDERILHVTAHRIVCIQHGTDAPLGIPRAPLHRLPLCHDRNIPVFGNFQSVRKTRNAGPQNEEIHRDDLRDVIRAMGFPPPERHIAMLERGRLHRNRCPTMDSRPATDGPGTSSHRQGAGDPRRQRWRPRPANCHGRHRCRHRHLLLLHARVLREFCLDSCYSYRRVRPQNTPAFRVKSPAVGWAEAAKVRRGQNVDTSLAKYAPTISIHLFSVAHRYRGPRTLEFARRNCLEAT